MLTKKNGKCVQRCKTILSVLFRHCRIIIRDNADKVVRYEHSGKVALMLLFLNLFLSILKPEFIKTLCDLGWLGFVNLECSGFIKEMSNYSEYFKWMRILGQVTPYVSLFIWIISPVATYILVERKRTSFRAFLIVVVVIVTLLGGWSPSGTWLPPDNLVDVTRVMSLLGMITICYILFMPQKK